MKQKTNFTVHHTYAIIYVTSSLLFSSIIVFTFFNVLPSFYLQFFHLQGLCNNYSPTLCSFITGLLYLFRQVILIVCSHDVSFVTTWL